MGTLYIFILYLELKKVTEEFTKKEWKKWMPYSSESIFSTY